MSAPQTPLLKSKPRIIQLETVRATAQVEGISPPSCPAKPLQPLAHGATVADSWSSLFLSRITHGCVPGTAVRGSTEKNTNKKHGECFPSLCGFISQFPSGEMTSGRAGAVFPHLENQALGDLPVFGGNEWPHGSDHHHVN